jgi:hypothetical protein
VASAQTVINTIGFSETMTEKYVFHHPFSEFLLHFDFIYKIYAERKYFKTMQMICTVE